MYKYICVLSLQIKNITEIWMSNCKSFTQKFAKITWRSWVGAFSVIVKSSRNHLEPSFQALVTVPRYWESDWSLQNYRRIDVYTGRAAAISGSFICWDDGSAKHGWVLWCLCTCTTWLGILSMDCYYICMSKYFFYSSCSKAFEIFTCPKLFKEISFSPQFYQSI